MPTFAQVLAARAAADPDAEVVRRVGDRPWTAADLWTTAAGWARSLDDLVAPGQVVVTAADSGPEAIALTAALSSLGAVELPVAPDTLAEWAHRLADVAQAVAILATAHRVEAQPLLSELASAAGVPLLRVGTDLAVDADAARHLRPREMKPTDPALIVMTSGTTGRSKAAVLPVGAPIGQARRVSEAMAYGPEDVVLNFFGWHHIIARNAGFLAVLLARGRMVVAPRFSASGFLDLVRAEGVTAFSFMGALCTMLLAQPPTAQDREHRVRAGYGGPAPAELVAAFDRRFGITLRQAYACTELGDVAVTSATQHCPGAAGRPVAEYDVRVVDEHGRPLPDGEIGELAVRPRRDGIAFLGYVGDPEATREAWRDGWFRTRDRARLTDGWLRIEGRLGDVIRRRGVNIDPQHVEQALLAHPDVLEAAAVAVPSELTEDEVLAVVVLADGTAVEAAELREHCRTRLPRHAVPRYVSCESELPHNSNLKVDRAALRRRGLPATAWDADPRTPLDSEA